MTSIWIESLGRSFEQALELLGAAVRDCGDAAWEQSMWPVPAPDAGHQFLRSGWTPASEPAERRALAAQWVLRRSTPWSVAWHALETLDYDLTGEFGPWSPPPPFAGHPHWRDLASLPAAWSRVEMVGYVGYCLERARHVLAEMNDELAARPLPAAHRNGGQPHAWILLALPGHTIEHAAQIRQFMTAASFAGEP